MRVREDAIVVAGTVAAVVAVAVSGGGRERRGSLMLDRPAPARPATTVPRPNLFLPTQLLPPGAQLTSWRPQVSASVAQARASEFEPVALHAAR